MAFILGSQVQSQGEQERKGGNVSFSDSLREIQGEYMMLGELYEKQKSYAQGLSEVIRTMQTEVDAVIQIKPEAMPAPCRAAYLVSEGVVVVFDLHGGMASKPLYALPSDVLVSIIQECTPELQRLLSEKRRMESNKVKSMESVLNELKRAQFMFKSAKREEMGLEEEADSAPQAEMNVPQAENHSAQSEQVEKELAAEIPKSKNPFAFIGTFGKTGAQQPSTPKAKKPPEHQ